MRGLEGRGCENLHRRCCSRGTGPCRLLLWACGRGGNLGISLYPNQVCCHSCVARSFPKGFSGSSSHAVAFSETFSQNLAVSWVPVGSNLAACSRSASQLLQPLQPCAARLSLSEPGSRQQLLGCRSRCGLQNLLERLRKYSHG